MKKVLCLFMSAMLLFSGCAAEVKEPAAEGGSYPLTLVDQAGREVVIEKEPETIISNYYISTSMLIALDQDEKLVGVENNAELRPVYELSAPQILELPGMGTVKEFDLERCAQLNPDLVILPAKLKDMCDALEQLDIPVLIVMPESEELLSECIDLLGKATNSSDRADSLNQFIDGQLSQLKEAVKNTEKPSAYLSGNSSFLKTAGPAMYQNNLLVNGGAENVAAQLSDSYWAEISYEQLLAWNPDYIVMAADAKYSKEDLLADEALSGCTAIQQGNVIQIPNSIESWDSPVPGSVLGSLWLASVLHPEEYSAEQYEQTVTEFYETFYGFTPEMK